MLNLDELAQKAAHEIDVSEALREYEGDNIPAEARIAAIITRHFAPLAAECKRLTEQTDKLREALSLPLNAARTALAACDPKGDDYAK